jgi:hypothetical protein
MFQNVYFFKITKHEFDSLVVELIACTPGAHNTTRDSNHCVCSDGHRGCIVASNATTELSNHVHFLTKNYKTKFLIKISKHVFDSLVVESIAHPSRCL